MFTVGSSLVFIEVYFLVLAYAVQNFLIPSWIHDVADFPDVDLLWSICTGRLYIRWNLPELVVTTLNTHHDSLQLAFAINRHEPLLSPSQHFRRHNLVQALMLNSRVLLRRNIPVGILSFLLQSLQQISSLIHSFIYFSPILLNGFQNLLILFDSSIKSCFINLHFLSFTVSGYMVGDWLV